MIDGVFYINLDHRTDRKEEIEEELNKVDLPFERIPGTRTSPGIIGCGYSHLAALKEARARGYSNVLIFEDDFHFLVDKETLNNQLNVFYKSKTDYDVLFLSYNCLHTEQLNEIVSRTKDVQTASGYIVNQRFYDKLIENLEQNYTLLETTGAHWLHLNDQCWKSLQKDNMFLHFNIRIGKQRPSFSDLSSQFGDYGV
jgi:GR25 family glycosyltransferase involved in LPS biosynthesis